MAVLGRGDPQDAGRDRMGASTGATLYIMFIWLQADIRYACSVPWYFCHCTPADLYCQCASQADAWQCPQNQTSGYYWLAGLPSDNGGSQWITWQIRVSAPLLQGDDRGRRLKAYLLLEINAWDSRPSGGVLACYGNGEPIGNLTMRGDWRNFSEPAWWIPKSAFRSLAYEWQTVHCVYAFDHSLNPTNIFVFDVGLDLEESDDSDGEL